MKLKNTVQLTPMRLLIINYTEIFPQNPISQHACLKYNYLTELNSTSYYCIEFKLKIFTKFLGFDLANEH